MNDLKMNGSLSFYFPCEVTTKGVSRLRKRWEVYRKRQREFIDHAGLPNTDLLDIEDYRDETEEILNQFIFQYLPTCDCLCPPFATPGIKKAYHGLREDTLFSKNLSVIFSRFHLSCGGIDFNPKEEGYIILNVNAENNVGTIIVSVPFSYLSANQIIFLKHVFYKRLRVNITDGMSGKTETNTIQQYISDLIHTELRLLKIKSVDYRARYSLLEIYNQNCIRAHAKEYYGMLKADESYEYIKGDNLKKTFGNNLFNKHTRGYYISDTNGLILHDIKGGNDTFPIPNTPRIYLVLNGTEIDSDKKRNGSRDECALHQWKGHIDVKDEKYVTADSVAGTKNNLFPEFLRAVEMHYMLDKVLTSEIVTQKRDQLNPLIFIPRAYKLWQILYEKAVNRYHVNDGIMESFGINKSISDVKEEYDSLQQLIVNFLLIILSVITILVTIIPKLCK